MHYRIREFYLLIIRTPVGIDEVEKTGIGDKSEAKPKP